MFQKRNLSATEQPREKPASVVVVTFKPSEIRSTDVRTISGRSVLLFASTLVLCGLTLFVLLSADAFSSSSPHENEDNWNLVFHDSFNTGALEDGHWTTCYWWALHGCTNLGNNELQWYQSDNVQVSDGTLTLEGRIQDIDAIEGHFSYTSGMITTGRIKSEEETVDRFSFKYGYIEVRAKAPSGAGMWPAIWLLPSNLTSTPEIDVMELLGHKSNQLELHYHYRVDGKKKSIGFDTIVDDLSLDWHTYAVDWSPQSIIWYLDGKEQWRLDDSSIISNEEMYLLINLAIGGDWPGPPTEETKFPAQLLVDHVKIWQRKQ